MIVPWSPIFPRCAVAIVRVADESFFIFAQADECGELGRNGEAAFVVQAGTDNDGAMDFRFSRAPTASSSPRPARSLSRDDAGFLQRAIGAVLVDCLQPARGHPNPDKFS